MGQLDRALAAMKSGVSADDALALVFAAEISEKKEGPALSISQSFFIRALEWAREEATEDNQLHGFAEAVFTKCWPENAKEAKTVKANDFAPLVKTANEVVAAAGVGGFTGDAAGGMYGPSKSYKKKKKKGVKESLLEYEGESRPCFRIEFDCFERALVMAVEKKMKLPVAKAFTNSIARFTGGRYEALTAYDLKSAWESYEESEEDEDEGEKKKKKK